MHLKSSLKNFSFGLAIVSLISAGAASAQSLSGVDATLDHTLDSKSAAVGQAVLAKLNESVKTTAGVELPRGTELIGKVAEVTTPEKGSGKSISLVFTTAKLQDGKEIPVKATLVGAYPAADVADGASADSIAPPPTSIDIDRTFDQQAGALRHVALTSAVKDDNSGTFSSSNGNFKLNAGTILQIGIAPAAGGNATSAAE